MSCNISSFFLFFFFFFFFSSRRRHTRWTGDWSSDVCSSDLIWLHDNWGARTVAANLASEHIPGFEAAYYLSGDSKGVWYDLGPGSSVPDGLNNSNRQLLGTLLNGHQPSVVVLLKDGYSFSSSTAHWKADHGGATWQSQHIPLIISGPGIRSGQTLS